MSSKPRSILNDWAGTNDKNELFDKLWVDTGIAGQKEKLPVGDRGFNISKLMRFEGQRRVGGPQQVEEGGKDGYGVVSIPNWTEGWAQYVEETYGHRNAFLALSAWGGSTENLVREHAEDSMKDAETVLGKVATKFAGNDDRKGVKNTKSPITGGIGSDPQGLIAATPILIDPDLVNTVRSQAPITDWVDVVAQAGFTASYNIISGREAPSHGRSTESEVRDVTGSQGSAYTLGNDEEDMKIWLDVLDISDFASRAMSSLDFMDLEGTSVEIRSQEYAVNMAEEIFYGNPAGGLSDGGPHDSEAPKGLYKWADDANTSYTIDRSGYSVTGDKPLFRDIKSYVHGILKNTAATPANLGIATSIDMFNALEDEANTNVRIDAFDGSVNFGRLPSVNTLSIANVPVLPDPNVRNHSYGSGQYDGNIGDVFIYERPRFQRRALMPFSSTTFGQLGLASRMGLFQYDTTIDKTQGEHVRVLENYSIDAVSDT